MKLAVFGAHAGAHFLSKKLLENNDVNKLYHIGSNSSIQPSIRYEPLSIAAIDDIIKFLETTELDFIVLTTVDFLRKKKLQDKISELKIPVCSASFDLTKLEWSKIKGKKLLQSLNIPTPESKVTTIDNLLNTFNDIPRPFVIKFEEDWRAGFQTVVINDDNYEEEYAELLKYGRTRFSKSFGEFSEQLLTIEKFTLGSREYSYHAICNEKNWQYLGSARDYKKLKENDIGCNTASMGCYSPVDINPIVHEYMDKIFNKLKENGTPYIGIIYLGILEDAEGTPHVLEINTRPGDPEFQSILLTHKNNIANTLKQTALNQYIDKIEFNDQAGVSIRIVNSNYRGTLNLINDNNIDQINDLRRSISSPNLWPEIPGRYISINKDRILLNAVISVSANTRTEASDSIYKFLKNIEMYDFSYRKDIGYLE